MSVMLQLDCTAKNSKDDRYAGQGFFEASGSKRWVRLLKLAALMLGATDEDVEWPGAKDVEWLRRSGHAGKAVNPVVAAVHSAGHLQPVQAKWDERTASRLSKLLHSAASSALDSRQCMS